MNQKKGLLLGGLDKAKDTPAPPFAEGKSITLGLRFAARISVVSDTAALMLFRWTQSRANGWFVLRSLIPPGRPPVPRVAFEA